VDRIRCEESLPGNRGRHDAQLQRRRLSAVALNNQRSDLAFRSLQSRSIEAKHKSVIQEAFRVRWHVKASLRDVLIFFDERRILWLRSYRIYFFDQGGYFDGRSR